MNMMELDGLAADVDALFGISGLKEDLMDVAYIGASAGVAVVGFEFLYGKVKMLQDANPWVKAGAAVAVGAAGGIAAGRYVHKAVGAGIAAGLIGWGVAKAIQKAASLPSMGALGSVSNRDLLLGMGVIDNDIAVSDYRPIPGQTSGLDGMTASDFNSMPGQTNGLGQAGNVFTNDLSPMPGLNGRDGFLSALT
jgi:hypothetical protein